ncbi:MAG: hypothetical protein ABI451_07830 [Dokdonella sp.]
MKRVTTIVFLLTALTAHADNANSAELHDAGSKAAIQTDPVDVMIGDSAGDSYCWQPKTQLGTQLAVPIREITDVSTWRTFCSPKLAFVSGPVHPCKKKPHFFDGDQIIVDRDSQGLFVQIRRPGGRLVLNAHGKDVTLSPIDAQGNTSTDHTRWLKARDEVNHRSFYLVLLDTAPHAKPFAKYYRVLEFDDNEPNVCKDEVPSLETVSKWNVGEKCGDDSKGSDQKALEQFNQAHDYGTVFHGLQGGVGTGGEHKPDSAGKCL